jgi:hypothetical protein
VKDTLQKESDEHDTLRVTVGVVYDDLKLAPAQETSSLTVRVTRITNRAHEMTWNTLHFGVQQSFVVARSHCENINLEAMGQGFAPGYGDDELDKIEKLVATLRET